jgi:excisionase family DNA binding protein
MAETSTKLYTISEVAEILKVSKPTVYRLFKDNRLEWCLVGSHRRVSQEQIDKYIQENINGNPQ